MISGTNIQSGVDLFFQVDYILRYILGGITMAYYINDDCSACGTCISECPVDAISEGDIYVIDADECTDCGVCVESCPVEAIVAG